MSTLTREQAEDKLKQLLAVARARKIKVDKTTYATQNSRLRSFRQTYRYDPLAFAHDIIKWKEGEKLSHYQ